MYKWTFDFLGDINNSIHPYSKIINVEFYGRKWVHKILGGLGQLDTPSRPFPALYCGGYFRISDFIRKTQKSPARLFASGDFWSIDGDDITKVKNRIYLTWHQINMIYEILHMLCPSHLEIGRKTIGQTHADEVVH